MRKTKLTSISALRLSPLGAKEKLKRYYSFKECDFFEIDNEIYLNCKDNVGIKATDLYQDLELQRKESYEYGGV